MMRKMIWIALTALMLALPCSALADYRIQVADGDLSQYPGLDENVKNILLIGIDSRQDQMEAGRADTMLVCSVNQATGVTHLTSLARDTWVAIGDNGLHNKLNAAYSFGGPNLLMQTINRTYHLNIEDYVTVNFYGICDIVDAFGGITLELKKGEPGMINAKVREFSGDEENAAITPVPRDAQQAHLCGAQALAYARIRQLDNDFGRQARQRNVLMAIARKVDECSMVQILSLAATCFEHVSTSLTMPEIIALAMKVMETGVTNIELHAYPQEGEFRYDSANGVSKLIIDPAKGIEKIHGYLYAGADSDE
ncbi:MAG: LCP family protein [Clostridia bacterium]|nr:LCP family protein [Clostridia bacterium]